MEQTVLGPHPHGTCKMSNDEDDGEGVDDTQFRLRHVNDLRVAGKSIRSVKSNFIDC